MPKQRTPEQKEARRKYQAGRRENGFCSSCSNKAVDNKTRCQKCLDHAAARAVKRYQNRKKLGVCPQCKKKPAEDGGIYCKDCLRYHKEKMDVRRQGDDYKEQQKKRAADWYVRKKAGGICPACSKPAVPGKVYCEDCNDENSMRAKKVRASRVKIVLAHYGTTCKCCGLEKEPEFLQVDHVSGGGRKHLEEIGQSRLYAWLIKNNFPSGFQVLCAECNFAWGHNRCCPHAKSRLVSTVIDDETVVHDPQTGKIVRNVH